MSIRKRFLFSFLYWLAKRIGPYLRVPTGAKQPPPFV